MSLPMKTFVLSQSGARQGIDARAAKVGIVLLGIITAIVV